jgi:hypothetical protein
MDLAQDGHRGAGIRGGGGGALAGQAGSDDQDVVCGHVALKSTGRRVPLTYGTTAVSARRTCSIVSTPRRTPLASTAITAPSGAAARRSRSASSGWSVPTGIAGGEDVADLQGGLARVDRLADAGALGQAEQPAVLVGHREPRRLVALEPALLGVDELRRGRAWSPATRP